MAPMTHDVGTRLQALTMLETDHKIPEIITATNLSERSIYRLRKVAKERGYNPDVSKKLLLAYVEDAPRIGRPKKATKEVEEMVIRTISKNSTTRELSTQKIADTLSPLVRGGISSRTVHRILRRRPYKPSKPTRKPGLTNENKLARLKWCLDYKDWTLEDWKNVIWLDETSVTMVDNEAGFGYGGQA